MFTRIRYAIASFLLIGFAGLAQADVVLNEVLGSTTSTDTEYVELFNSGPGAVDISGWTIERWDSDAGTSFGGVDGGGPFTVPAGVTLVSGEHYLFANQLAQDLFGVTADVTISNNSIENSSYTIVLRDGASSVVNSIFVRDSGPSDAANIAGMLITPDATIGPDGSFLPAGFNRTPDGSNTFIFLEFSPRPAPSGTPTALAVPPPPPVAVVATIMEIQGASHSSPLVGEFVETTGIVTATDSNAFYLQDPTGDGDIATSDAVLIFTGGSPAVAVGDAVTVEGDVVEFFPGGQGSGNLSTTELSSPDVVVNSSGNPLPAPIILGAAGRSVPTENIDDDAFTSFDPVTDGLDYFESVEAMRVMIQSPLAVAPTSRFGEIYILGDNGNFASGLSLRQTLNIAPGDFNPETIQIDEDTGILPGFNTPDIDTGATFSDITGVVNYGFGHFEVYPTAAFTTVDSVLSAEQSAIASGVDVLTIASYNLLNIDTNDGDGDADVANGRFDAIADQIVNSLNSPDILGVQEIQDNDGSNNSGVTAADVTLQAVVDAIEAAGGPQYQFEDTQGLVNNSVGGQPGANIRVAFLYNPARVTLMGPASLLTDPVDQSVNSANPFYRSRIPLAAEFEFNREKITVINNHLSSKGGSSPIFGSDQPFDALQEDPTVNGSLDERQTQASAVRDYVSAILLLDPDANVAVLGDMNEFEFVSPVQDLLGQDLDNTTFLLSDNERYSFIFEGNSQQLDHILLSSDLLDEAEFDIVHVNSEFFATNQRASDHDPLLTSVVIPLVGDLNDDGVIDFADFVLFRIALGSFPGHPNYDPEADLDGDGRVTRLDRILFMEIYNAVQAG